MENIEVEEYIRTKQGKLDKVINPDFYMNRYIECEKELIFKHDIVKHSKDIIELIETNDYVNRYRVEDISIETNEVLLDNNGFSWRTLQAKDTILTKEQYDQNCYSLEG